MFVRCKLLTMSSFPQLRAVPTAPCRVRTSKVLRLLLRVLCDQPGCLPPSSPDALHPSICFSHIGSLSSRPRHRSVLAQAVNLVKVLCLREALPSSVRWRQKRGSGVPRSHNTRCGKELREPPSALHRRVPVALRCAGHLSAPRAGSGLSPIGWF